ncbi:MAG TPA: iron ABC transporter permease [Oscillospiraceae bacterium]|nr:iron ABC transporter permease [Oscillospiraceae bacterium]
MTTHATRNGGLSPAAYLLFAAALAAALLLGICLGSVPVAPGETFRALAAALRGTGGDGAGAYSIVVTLRLPRVLCVALMGASLSLCGGAMQGLLRNPLADGSTLGVSSGAALGAAVAIAFGVSIPGLPGAGAAGTAMLSAFLSLVFILTLAYRLDASLSTNTILLLGVVFSLFTGSLLSLVITFAGSRLRPLLFWTMGSLSGSGYGDALALALALLLCGGTILFFSRELDAFSLGEPSARHVGVDVRRTKLIVLVAVSALIGICVSIGGSIGFVGLVVPHMARMLFGPSHRRLLPASLFGGATFLLLADLASRVVLAPLELPIGVVTSLIGSVVFVRIFYLTRKAE